MAGPGGKRPGAGRPKGTENLETKLRREQKALLVKMAENKLEPIFTKMLAQAEAGDDKARKELFDRLWGKANQTIDANFTGELDVNNYGITDEQLARVVALRGGTRASETPHVGVLDSDQSEVPTKLAPSGDSGEARGGGEGGDQTTDDLHATPAREEPASLDQLPGVVPGETS